MRFSAAGTQGLAICLAAGLGLAGMTRTACRQAAAEEIAAERPADVLSPDVGPRQPGLHAEVYWRLAVPVKPDFHQVAVGKVLRRLADSTGVDMELVDDSMAGARPRDFERVITLMSRKPVSLQMAIRLALGHASGYCLTLGDKGVRIVSQREAADQYVLETHDLWSASDYTTRLRTRFIEQVRRDIVADDWGREGGPWIIPSRSVLAVDVYHKPEVQRQIDELWQREYLGTHIPTANDFESPPPATPLNKKTASPEAIEARAEQLRKEYPLVSLADRLDYERNGSAAKSPALSPQIERRLAAREKKAGGDWPGFPDLLRVESLKQLHGDEVKKFVSRPGFGLSRTVQPDPYFLPLVRSTPRRLPSAEIDPPAGEVAESLSASTSPTEAGPAALPALDQLATLHETGLNSFLSRSRFGYIQDREHVAGFGSHGFENLPRLERLPSAPSLEPTEQWAIRRLELVSLLKHDTPLVYLSDELPRMDALREAATRPLNEFETEALPRLIDSEEIIARATTNRIEMVGAIRAAKQCTECHKVERGQLLGAFTYTLVRDPWVAPVADGSATYSNSATK